MYLYGLPSNWLTATYVFLQEAVIKKKYGGILPRKTPLISKVNTLPYDVTAALYIFKLCDVLLYINRCRAYLHSFSLY
jgi:hypothetical protein